MTENDIPTAYQYAEGASSEALARYDEGALEKIPQPCEFNDMFRRQNRAN
jgi:hypothetical protein